MSTGIFSTTARTGFQGWDITMPILTNSSGSKSADIARKFLSPEIEATVPCGGAS